MSEEIALVLGANGQLGREIAAVCNHYKDYTFYFADRNEIDILDQNLNKIIYQHNPSIVINCAAYTAVDNAESNSETSYAINAHAAASLAQACKSCKATLIHISSDYVYHIQKAGPLLELDETDPKSIYAKSKLEGEHNIERYCPEHIIIRTSWLYSTFGNNFVKTMLKLAETRNQLSIVNDQWGAPTYARDLAHAICNIACQLSKTETNEVSYGTYNYANEGITSWLGFAEEIFASNGLNVQITPISTESYNAAAQRPKWSLLSTQKIKKTFKLDIPHWRESLNLMLKNLSPNGN